MYHYLRQAWKKPSVELLKDRLIQWRAGEAVVKLEKPTRLDRARSLGYKAKNGIIVVRVRIKRGGRKRSMEKKGRKSRKTTIRKTLKMNYQWVAEGRAAMKYRNLEVLNSYWVGRDGKHYYFEVILVDPDKPEIKNDRTLNFVVNNRKRTARGLTSAGKKSRGLTSKRGKSPTLKVRPSLRARERQGK